MNKNEVAISQTATPATLLEMAIQKGVDTTQLKELMDLQERWEKKEAKKAFLDAKSLFLSKVPVIRKNRIAKVQMKSGGSYSYRFADAGNIHLQIKKPLHECGLSYGFTFTENNDDIEVSCVLSHRDGHSETTTMKGKADASGGKNDIQQKGSTITYLQRYTLLGALGLSTADEDNDGKTNSTAKEDEKLSEEEILAQWQQVVDQATSRVQLTSLYNSNRKSIDSNDKVKAIFKTRQEQLPEIKKTVMA